jgi:hypothetical protein
LVTNPWFAVNTAGWTATNATIARSTLYRYQGPAAGLLTASGANATATTAITAAADVHTAQWIVRNLAAASRTVQLRYNGANIGSAVALASGEQKTITAQFTGTGASANLELVVTDSANGEQFVVYYAGAEQRAYATSPCPFINSSGNLLPGYSWSGTAHASTSTRAATTLTFSPAGRIAPLRGSVVLAARRVVSTGANQTLLDVGNGGAGTDRLTLRFTQTGALQLACQSNGGAVTTVTTAETAALGSEVICYAAWDGTDISVRLGSGNIATGTRDAPAGSFGAGNAALGTRQDGSEPLNGALGPVLVYASPLSPMRRDVLVARGPARWRYDLVRAA